MSRTLDLPGVYPELIPPDVPVFEGRRPTRIAIIGKFAAGPIDTPTLATRETLRDTFGGVVPGSAGYDAYYAFLQGVKQLYLVRVQGTAADVTIKDRQTPTPANKLTLTVRVDGTWANYAPGPPESGISAVVADGTTTGTFKLTVEYAYPMSDETGLYSEEFDNLSLDDESPRYFETIINAGSKLVTAVDEDPAHSTADYRPAAGTYSLADGAEPDYEDAVDSLDSVRGRLIVLTDTDDETNRALLVNKANERTMQDGTIVVLNCPLASAVADIAEIAGEMSEERAVVMGPWPYALDSELSVVRSMRPAGFRAGVLARLHPTESPTNQRVLGIVSAEYAMTRADLVTLQEAGCSPDYLWPDDESRGFRCINGIATDGTQVFIRRSKDWVADEATANAAWAVGKMQGEADPDPLRTALRGQFYAYYEVQKLQGIIDRFSVKCDAENNLPATVQARELHLALAIKLKQVADYILLDLTVGPESAIAREE